MRVGEYCLEKASGLGDNHFVAEYIEKQGDAYQIAGTRVSLDSIVYAFQRGASPESIQRSFPTITLEAVYGAITYYLANQEEIDGYLAEGDAQFAGALSFELRRLAHAISHVGKRISCFVIDESPLPGRCRS